MNNQIFQRIVEKKKALDKKRPLAKAVLAKIREQFSIELTYNSNAIEGNTLTLAETKMVLEEGITIKGKPLIYHLEAQNHQEAIFELEKIVNRKTKINEELLKHIHSIILQNIEKDFAGEYRREQVRILGADFIPPNYLKINKLMKDFANWLAKNPDRLNIIELAAQAHFRLTYIHPWVDGNGRVARLLMNIILMKGGYPPAIILNNDRKKYLNALKSAQHGNFDKFYLVVAQAVERSLDLYLMSTGITPEELVPLSVLSKNSEFSSKYLNLLARTGRLEAIKMGRNWLSSKESLERYLKNRKRIR